jgi:hypothetical protein
VTQRTANAVEVTSRDIELLVSLYRYRCLSTAQVKRLLFPSDQTVRRRLHHLAGAGYLRVLRIPGVAERVVVLADRGADLVAGQLGVPPETITYATLGREMRHPFFVQHHLDVTDFRLSLEHECRTSSFRLLGFLPEFINRRVEGGRIEKYLRDVIATGDGETAHVSDGVFAVERDGRAALFHVEIDRGTEVVSRPDRGVLKAMRFYLDYLRQGAYQRYRDDFGLGEPFSGFRVLFVTTSDRRITRIRDASASIDNTTDGARRFIWLAPQARIDAEGVLQATWKSLDPTDTTSYRIDPHPKDSR